MRRPRLLVFLVMERRRILLVLLFALIGSTGEPAAQSRGELRVWTARAIATVLAEIGPEFEQTTGYRLVVTSDLPDAFVRRAAAGEPFDLPISSSVTVDEWIKNGRVAQQTRTDIARSGIGVEVRAGAPKPDISSVDAFKRALLAAKSIAYLRAGSGIYMASLVERLGIAEAISEKSRGQNPISCPSSSRRATSSSASSSSPRFSPRPESSWLVRCPLRYSPTSPLPPESARDRRYAMAPSN